MAFIFESDLKAFLFCLLQFVIAIVVSYSFSNYTNPEQRKLEKVAMLELKVEQTEKDIEQLRDLTRSLEGKYQNIESVHVPLVAFHVYNPLHTNLEVGQVIVYQTVPLNEGNGYDRKTGIFTTPVTGLYQFSAHICNQDNAMFVYAIVLEGETIALSTQRDMPSSCNTVNALTVASAGQQVSVQGVHMSKSYQVIENPHRKNSFNGVLLHRT
ncbi:uncharacterized protein LOC132741007 [Ruditapes philippinarum]|uniref:uncharacterized protein LOC132741007 n=1 Tax=Ruditapes philippinarum TaxID=129788 RepID=UPI00295B8B48|nr:uncharacterized protein LOC132741007 [Ruditapes philippinarum]